MLYAYAAFSDELTVADLSYVRPSPRSVPSVISKEDAREDVDFLFAVLKHGYAGYQFFGGDEAFAAAKQGIIAEIDTTFGANLTYGDLSRLLHQHLGFIQDGHFAIAGRPTCRRHTLYAHFDLEFEEHDGRFYERHNPGRWAVAVEGNSPSTWMKASISPDGEVVYCLGTLSDADSAICVELEWSDGSSESVWRMSADYVPLDGPAYEFQRIDGIPVATSRSLAALPDTTAQLDALVRDAAGLSGEPALILDLRSNVGGSSWYAQEWVTRFSGAAVCPVRFHAQLTAKTAAAMFENTMSSMGMDWVTLREMLPEEDSGNYPDVSSWLASTADPARPGWSKVLATDGVRAENDTMLVVLIDSYVSSAGEDFIEYLRQLENVVLVGTNTWGAMLAGNVGICLLPNSKLVLQCGTKISLTEDLANRDGLGYMPDLWVRPEQALERAVSYVRAMLPSDAAANR